MYARAPCRASRMKYVEYLPKVCRIATAEVENLEGQGGLEPPSPLFDMNPPKLEVVMKNI